MKWIFAGLMRRWSGRALVALAVSTTLAVLGMPALETAGQPSYLAADGATSLGLQNPLPRAPESSGPSDPREVEQFADALVNRQMATYHIPGALVVVVAEGEVLMAKGYGYADLETQTLFSGDRTLFRIGSTGKLFTWTAVMQLAERGELDLDADINRYLKDFQIPATYPEPITMKHLMSHSAGFEDRNLGTIAPSLQEIMPLGEYVRQFPPDRVRPPGRLTAYSNYGAALAGYIVETVSGEPFEQYVDDNILAPLGMNSTSFRQPLPSGLAERLAISYGYADTFRPEPMMFLNLAPAGSLSSSGTDLARFMIAHLEDGCYQEACILERSTVEQMHQRLFSNDPRFSGMAYGFMDRQINGQRILEHGGGLPSYYGLMALLPEHHVGFYVGYTSRGAGSAIPEFCEAFLNHYYPPYTESIQPLSSDPGRTRALAGRYQTTRRNYTSLERTLDLTGMGQARVTANPGGGIHLDLAMGTRQLAKDFVEIRPGVFISPDSKQILSFLGDPEGRRLRLILDSNPEVAFERIQWYEDPLLIAKLQFICLVILSSAFPISAFEYIRRRRTVTLARHFLSDKVRVVSLLACALDIAIVTATAGLMLRSGLVFERPVHAALLAGMAWLAALLCVVITILTAHAWIRSDRPLVLRLYYTLVAISTMGFTWCLAYWNLL